MKQKLFSILALLLMTVATGAMAQSTPITTVRSWNFTKGGNHTDWASAQAAATSVWGGPDSSLRYSNANNLSGEELTDGTKPLKGLAGIYFTAPAGSLLLGGVNSSTRCLQTNGDGVSILLPDCAAKDRITLRFCASVSDETVTITSDQMKSSYVANSTDRSNEVSAFVKENGNVVLNVPSKVRIYEIKVEPYVAVTNFNLSAETVTVTENKTVTVTATGFSPSNAFDKTLEWTTADDNVATVANGVITGVNPGTTTITVTSVDGPSKTIGVTVLPTYSVTLAEGTEDADKWTIEPNTGLESGETVIATYSGTKKVKSVKAVKKGGAVENAYLAWDKDQKKLVATEILTTATKVENADAGVEWQAGTYVVEGEDVKINGGITLNGTVDLIIKDGAKLTAQKIIGKSNNLSVYGQAQKTGELVVDNSGDDATTSIKTLEVHSAKVTATSSYNNRGGFYYIGTINVYGGSVDATAANGYGIWLRPDGSINIYGGEVKAVGKGTGNDSYGIKAGNSSTVTVNGGKLWAENANKQAINTSNVTLKKGDGFTGKIETSANGTSWTEYTEAATPTTKYVRVGY